MRNKIIGNAITRYLSPQSRIFEVGCGNGYVSLYLKKMEYRVECADLLFDSLQFCKGRNSGDHYYQFNLSDRILLKNLTAFDILEYIDDDAVMKNVHDALNRVELSLLRFLLTSVCGLQWISMQNTSEDIPCWNYEQKLKVTDLRL